MVLNIFRLQKENENLVGKYAVHSNVLQSEVINLPSTVDVSNLINSENNLLCLQQLSGNLEEIKC